ncbi:MAG: hypothetical protein KKB50_07500 [Planctomycetes bacterium]|nr:hypothetical protein [Planctomycetota bacterium]
MLAAARRAPTRLLEAADKVVEFLIGQINSDGGARNRAGESDLYYTVFALNGLAAMDVELPSAATSAYLRSFGAGGDLDFVHLTCLARCWAAMPAGSLDTPAAAGILRRIEACRSADGGYGSAPRSARGTVYDCFLALGAYQDLAGELPDPQGMARCLSGLRSADGAYANERDLPLGTTPATAAAVVLLRQLNQPVPRGVDTWLEARVHERGGFLAAPQAPMPDLLSTATALHALAALGARSPESPEATLDFLDSLWTGRAFRGNWADDIEDCEYTFYALLALGHLSA